MRFKLIPLVAAITIAGGFELPAYADAPLSTPGKEQVARLIAQTQSLEKELKLLKAEVLVLKQRQPNPHANTRAVAVAEVKIAQHPAELEKPTKSETNFEQQRLLLGGTPVVSSPYLTNEAAFNASDLMVNQSTYNIDVQLLKQRKQLEATRAQQGLSSLTYPLLQLSGKLEGQVVGVRDYSGTHTSDVNLSGSEIDIVSHVNSWVSGYMGFDYDSDAPQTGSGQVNRYGNSRLYLNKGFITLGNLNRSPLYATIGQRFVPFGQYVSYMITSPTTMILSRVKGRALLVGYQPMNDQGLYGSAYTFKGDNKVSATGSNINQYGATIGYLYNAPKLYTDFGVDYIANIADAEGMQKNGYGTGFSGFGASNASEILNHRVPGLALHGTVGVDKYTLMAEYTGATRAFAAQNLSFNGSAARPTALHLEGAYSLNAFNRPSTISIGMDHTSDALAFNLPKQRYIAVFNTSIWKDTIAGLEYRHDINYSGHDVAAGQGVAVPKVAGKISNTLTAQFGLYF